MKVQTDPVLNLQSRIARRRERIAKWDTEAREIEASWTGGPDYKTFCQGMAEAARKKKEELEAKLEQLQGRQDRNGNGPVRP
jgi:chromosome segregation ATPase